MSKRLSSFGYRILLLLACFMPSIAFAGPCSAEADSRGFHEVERNKYNFMFSVHAGWCGDYPCEGFVRFAVKFHYNDDVQSKILVDRLSSPFTIDKGRTQVNVSNDHDVTIIDKTITIDDVIVESVSCNSP